ncbi:hypothetical protein BJP36_37740 [Moorena producens JHB]|uniref:Uncharacterized protein n=1 Tax=Moorena producens (strain JHB) TaxID=1454205 RepID=A0A9Q9SUE7_MOOP1|nr:hypothetical protein [Moorena producens]WAN69838.1 hypothetical protein BJP36_37740 [Moorena producens JHB]
MVSTISDCVNIGIVRKWGIGNAIAPNFGAREQGIGMKAAKVW